MIQGDVFICNSHVHNQRLRHAVGRACRGRLLVRARAQERMPYGVVVPGPSPLICLVVDHGVGLGAAHAEMAV